MILDSSEKKEKGLAYFAQAMVRKREKKFIELTFESKERK
jgi:hypothetical protein